MINFLRDKFHAHHDCNVCRGSSVAKNQAM
jgi:hypothetical protein